MSAVSRKREEMGQDRKNIQRNTDCILPNRKNKQTNTQTHQSPTKVFCSYSKTIPSSNGKVRELG